ncbi:MAG: nitrate reductase associated protein [Elainellaceae cyanobacterium]
MTHHPTQANQFFQFEADFVDSLRCIPMQVRLKLDTCGIKLKLHQWNQFTQDERQRLVESPCKTEAEILAYRAYLTQIIHERTGEAAKELTIDPTPPWQDDTQIPESIRAKVDELGVSLTPSQWAALDPLQRFALIKLSRSSHENSNFLPAMKEFHLV